MNLGYDRIGNKTYGNPQMKYRPRVNPLAHYPLESIMGRMMHQSNVNMFDDPRGILFPKKRLTYDASRGLIPTRMIDRYSNEYDRVQNFGQDYSLYNSCSSGFVGHTPYPDKYKTHHKPAHEGVSMSSLQDQIDDDFTLKRLEKERASFRDLDNNAIMSQFNLR